MLCDGGLPLKGAIDGGARDREDFSEVADAVVAGVVHAPQLAGPRLTLAFNRCIGAPSLCHLESSHRPRPAPST